jgi:cytochrome c
MPPLGAQEAETILAYLSTYYGPNPPPIASPDTLATASADPVQKLLDANACMGCHAVDRKLVGPGFREVAAKYSGDAGASARLAAKIRSGGKGAWGEIPMPGNSVLTDAELSSVAGWVMQQK